MAPTHKPSDAPDTHKPTADLVVPPRLPLLSPGVPLPERAHSRASWPEFARGAVAATTNLVLTFPLNKLISRQAYEGLGVRAAAATLIEDGLPRLYRGLAPPLAQKAVAMGVMYGTYDFYFHTLLYHTTGLVEARPATDVPAGEAPHALRAAAAVAAGITEGVLTPFERVQTLLQHRHYTDSYKNAGDVVTKLAPRGVGEFYVGWSAVMLRNAPANALWFTLRDPVREKLTGWLGGVPGVAADFLAGALLGAAISTCVYPLNLAKSVMQLQVGGVHAGVWPTAVGIVKDRGGVGGLYRGAGVNALRSMLSWGLVNAACAFGWWWWDRGCSVSGSASYPPPLFRFVI